MIGMPGLQNQTTARFYFLAGVQPGKLYWGLLLLPLQCNDVGEAWKSVRGKMWAGNTRQSQSALTIGKPGRLLQTRALC
jgi:hypothetical protein